MIRRSKENTIELPPRHDKVVRIRFTPDEKVHYRKIEQPVVTMLDDAIGTQKGMGGLWVNAIQQINKLRIACNLGIFTASSQPMQVQPKLKDKDLTLEILATRLSMGDNACEQCLQVIVSSDSNLCSERRNISPNAYYSSCRRLFCVSCARLFRFKSPAPCGCGARASPCPLQPLPSTQLTPRVTPIESSASPKLLQHEAPRMSSKVRALVSEIQANPTEKR